MAKTNGASWTGTIDKPATGHVVSVWSSDDNTYVECTISFTVGGGPATPSHLAEARIPLSGWTRLVAHSSNPFKFSGCVPGAAKGETPTVVANSDFNIEIRGGRFVAGPDPEFSDVLDTVTVYGHACEAECDEICVGAPQSP